ncbi:MAG: hypothetical protein E7813_15335 [Bradyrhizobium sp.]|uniref:hypothetical protein n=1 Tax=Bradyrhizobium sp. TaxID=376 RepID=UPI001229EB7E|nr:hypothetical protein [Bradyrhizobium sp.]THD65333.1 MAG: hypothetical protein E7813_15335 [Bradyrhizobium sp.]
MTSATKTATVEPTFEQRIVDALTDDTISANDLHTLFEKTTAAISVADNDAKIAKATALDPLQSPDAAKARQIMEDTEFKADRLRNLLPRLRERFIKVGNHEDYVRWRIKHDALKPKVNDAAARLKAVYQTITEELIPLLQEIEKIDAEVSKVSSTKPWHAREANGDGCVLRAVELTARGLDGFNPHVIQITEIKLPDWNDRNKLIWPPYRHIDYAALTGGVRPHPGADLRRVKEEEEERKRAEATRLEAELQQQQARDRDRVARAADDRRRGIIAL